MRTVRGYRRDLTHLQILLYYSPFCGIYQAHYPYFFKDAVFYPIYLFATALE